MSLWAGWESKFLGRWGKKDELGAQNKRSKEGFPGVRTGGSEEKKKTTVPVNSRSMTVSKGFNRGVFLEEKTDPRGGDGKWELVYRPLGRNESERGSERQGGGARQLGLQI